MPTSQGQIITNWFQGQTLADMLAVVASGNFNGVLSALKVALIAAPFSPNQDSVFTDFTEATFTGYAESSDIAWGTPIIQPDGSSVVVGGVVQFTVGSTPTVTDTIYGLAVFAVVSSVKTLAWVEMFDEGFQMTTAGQAIVVVPIFGPALDTSTQSTLIT